MNETTRLITAILAVISFLLLIGGWERMCISMRTAIAGLTGMFAFLSYDVQILAVIGGSQFIGGSITAFALWVWRHRPSLKTSHPRQSPKGKHV